MSARTHHTMFWQLYDPWNTAHYALTTLKALENTTTMVGSLYERCNIKHCPLTTLQAWTKNTTLWLLYECWNTKHCGLITLRDLENNTPLLDHSTSAGTKIQEILVTLRMLENKTLTVWFDCSNSVGALHTMPDYSTSPEHKTLCFDHSASTGTQNTLLLVHFVSRLPLHYRIKHCVSSLRFTDWLLSQTREHPHPCIHRVSVFALLLFVVYLLYIYPSNPNTYDRHALWCRYSITYNELSSELSLASTSLKKPFEDIGHLNYLPLLPYLFVVVSQAVYDS